MENKQINVGGQVFLLSCRDLENGPSSRLKQMFIDGSLNSPTAVVIHRPSELFAAILAFYQTGELHIPASACPVAFKNELRFWNIPLAMLSTCCRNRMNAFIEDQNTLENFMKTVQPVKHKMSSSRFQKYRHVIWSIVDYTERSPLAKIYFLVSLLMILMSIFVMAYGTDPRFQRAMTNCERLEYMATSGMEGYELAKKALENKCDEHDLPVQVSSIVRKQSIPDPKNYPENEYAELYIPFNENFAHLFDDEDTETTTFTLVDLPTAPSLNETRTNNERFLKLPKRSGKYIWVPDMKIKIYSLVILEIICIVYFTIDFILRITTCPSVKFYFLSIINTTDAFALTGMITNLVILSIYELEKYKLSWMNLLEYTQMLRALRLFRIVSSLKAGRVLAYSLRTNYKELFVLVVFLVAGMCTFASVLFITEDKENVNSIPYAWYWVIVTMTTVGYGDMVPHTDIGRLVCCICAISGVLLFALTVPIFANNFLTLYQFAGHDLVEGESETFECNMISRHEMVPVKTDQNHEIPRENESNKKHPSVHQKCSRN